MFSSHASCRSVHFRWYYEYTIITSDKSHRNSVLVSSPIKPNTSSLANNTAIGKYLSMTCKQRELQMFTKNRKVKLGIQCKAQLMGTLSLPSCSGWVQTLYTNMVFLPVTYICHISSLQLIQLKRLLSTACLLQWCSYTTSLLVI